MQVRQATLDDTQAISALFCARIEKWQRLNAQQQVEDVPYSSLTIYERWLHGGVWLSIETGAVWLSHLLRGAGTPLVLVNERDIIGYAELYEGSEPAPCENHFYLAHFLTATGAPDHAADTLMNEVLARAAKTGRLLAACSAYDAEQVAFFQRCGLVSLLKLQQVSVTAQPGQSFYKATENPEVKSPVIKGWGMPIGHLTSARHQWESLWYSHWDAVPEIMARRIQRLHINAAGHEAYLIFQERLYDPRSAEVFCWSPKPLTQQLLFAIRDRGYRQGYRTLLMTVTDKVAALIGSDAEAGPLQQEIFYRDIP